jgi:hypothetical protein
LCKRLINQQRRDARMGRRSQRRALSGLATPVLRSAIGTSEGTRIVVTSPHSRHTCKSRPPCM